ncbi:flavoprotein [Nocardia sp. CDC160]|uniref:flavoprotein n=1 Tax=Nocardia sp. CDC160 TaxID=3112166 RepID=UPI002DBCD9D8|nr:flavoprotein [Nocardia sp. CDC160]MEC3915531.1 flavoprotein [Nocardia sp. CDC160]
MNDQGIPVLYAIVTGSSRAQEIEELVDLAQADGWDVCVVASPSGLRFIDAEGLAAKTGHPVRANYKEPGTPDLLPPADGMIVAPLTCNSASKWAAGISDTLPLGLLIEAVGKGLPVIAVPYSSPEQMSFPPVQDALRNLATWGIGIIPGVQGKPLPLSEAWRAFVTHPRSR